MTRRKRGWFWAAGICLGVVGIIAFALTRPDPDLQALQADPMATASVEGATEVRRFENESGTTLGKPQYASIMRVFEVDVSPEVALARSRDAAGEAGWILVKDDELSAEYAKDFGEFDASLTLIVQPEGTDGDEGPVLSLFVERR